MASTATSYEDLTRTSYGWENGNPTARDEEKNEEEEAAAPPAALLSQRPHRESLPNDEALPANRDNHENDENDSGNNNTPKPSFVVSESELLYSIESYGAIVLPVSITMILAAVAVVFLNTPESLQAGAEAYARTYQVFDVNTDSQTNAQTLGVSIANTFIIVSAICLMTFVVVLLYKYRCLFFLYGYLLAATAALLGYFTSAMFKMFIQIYGWWGRGMDKLTFAFILYNYVAVGILAIFYGRGIPKWIAQGYLIASSVAVAWQLSYFDEWTAWTLLVMLALYDLFAVLSPCGPLKALAEQISRPGAPALPGLLYEASLSAGVSKRKQKPQENVPAGNGGEEEETQAESADKDEVDSSASDPSHWRSNITTTSSNISTTLQVPSSTSQEDHTEDDTGAMEVLISSTNADSHHINRGSASHVSQQSRNQGQRQWNNRTRHDGHEAFPPTNSTMDGVPSDVDSSNTAQIPLALAKMYKLSIIDERGVLRKRRFASTWQRYYTSDEIRGTSGGEPVHWTAKQLRSEVTAIMPPRGGRIEKCPADQQKYDEGLSYEVFNRVGEVLRKFVVTEDGKVMQVVKKSDEDRVGEDEDDTPGTIKLGLGDFVFYSVLVAKAAQYSFTTFVACFLVVLFGLASTLVILAFYGKALPALPISIFLAVIVYIWTRGTMQPWIEEGFLVGPFYV